MTLFDEIKNSNTADEMVKLFEQMVDKWASTDKSTKEILTETNDETKIKECITAIKTLFPEVRSVTRSEYNHAVYVRDIEFTVIASFCVPFSRFPIKIGDTITIKK